MGNDLRYLSAVMHVHDERIESGASLHLEDAQHGIRIESVRREAINGLRGDGHELPLAQQQSRARDVLTDGRLHPDRARRCEAFL